MIKKILLSALLALTIMPLSAQNLTAYEASSLAKQCYILTAKIDRLSYKQMEDVCEIVLDNASYNINMAGTNIINEQHAAAKHSLQTAIKQLTLAETLNCNNLAEISLYKNETIQIDSQITE